MKSGQEPSCATLWGLFVTAVMVLLFFERPYFTDVFREAADYAVLAGSMLTAYVFLAWIGPRLSVPQISISLFITALVQAAAWFLLATQIPLEEMETGNCSAPMCSFWGQWTLILLACGLTPPLLIEWTRRQTDLNRAENYSEGLFSGIALIGIGMISHGGYYLGCAGAASLYIAIAFIIFKQTRDYICRTQDGSRQEPGICTMNLRQAIRDAILLAWTGVFGLMLLERDAVDFGMLSWIGIGMVAFDVTRRITRRHWPEPGATTNLEGITLGVAALSAMWGLYLAYWSVALPESTSIPLWITGFAWGYFWHRIALLASNVRLTSASGQCCELKKMPRPFGQKLGAGIFLTIAFLMNVTSIGASGIVKMVLYACGLALIGLGLVMWSQKKSPKLAP